MTSGGKTLSAGTDYTYDAATGKVAVSDKAVTGDIKIKAEAAKLLDNITDALPDFKDKWYTTESTVLNTADGWTVSTSQYGSFTGSVTLDGEGASLTKSLYFRDGSGKLYYYKLTYKRDTVSPVIDSITNPGGSGSKEISFNVSDSVSGIQSVTVICNDNDPVIYDNDSFTADRNGSYTITVTDNAGNRSIEYVTVSDLHTHSYTYAVSQGNAAQIIESCSCGHKQTAVLSCTGSGSYTYTGSAITPVNVTYSDGWVGERPTTFSYSDNINAGTGKASITIGGVNAVKSFEITKAVPVLTDPAAQNGITYGGSLSSVVLTDGWSWEDADTVPTVSNSGYTAYYIPSDTANYDWTQIQGWNQTDGRVERTVSVGVSKADLTVNIQKASSVYGDGIAELKATAVGIVNGDTDVYSLSTTATGTSDVGNYDITGMSNNGNYNITFTGGTDAYTITRRELTVTIDVADKRYDGTKNAEIISAVLGNAVNGDNITLNRGTAAFATEKAGTDISISLAGFYISGEKSGNYTLILPTDIKADITNGWNPEADTEYTASEPNGNGWLNEDMVITAKNGYKVSLTDTADGEWKDTLTGTAERSDGSVKFYVKNVADGTISEMVTVNYRLDKGNPGGKVYFDERNIWKEFLDTNTFDLFYGSKVTVKADAQDSISGIARIEFIEASVQMSLEELKDSGIAWKELPEGGKEITVEDGKRFICYIRITDNAGNVTYISTDGAEYDTTAPVINGVENGKTYYTTQTVTVTDDNVASITLNGEAAGADITLNGNEDKVYTITVTDKAGNETMVVVTMKPIAAVNESIEGITVDNVKSSDKETIEDVIGQIDGLLKFAGLTDEERTMLSSAKQEAEKLIRKIGEAADENREISEQIAALDKNTATSSDKQAVQDLIERAEELLNGNNLTDEEREALEQVKEKAVEVVEQIEEAGKSTVTENTDKVEDITSENVTPEDKTDLEDAKADLEEALKEHGSNMTEDEKKSVQEEINRIDNAIEVVKKVEDVQELIGKLSDIITSGDADAVKAAQEAYEKLTDYEKSFVDKKKLDEAIEILAKPDNGGDTPGTPDTPDMPNTPGTSDTPDTPDTPPTGDASDIWFWFVLMFASGMGILVTGFKRRQLKR